MQKLNPITLLFIIIGFSTVFCVLHVSSETVAEVAKTSGNGKLYTLDELASMTDEISKTAPDKYSTSTSIIIANEVAPDILQVDAGTTLTFEKGCFLRIDGVLIASGEFDNEVIFSSARNPKKPGDWAGISFSSSCAGDSSVVDYCRVEYANVGIRCEKNSVRISNCQITDSASHAIAFHSASSTVSKSKLSSNGFSVVWCVSSDAKIMDNEISVAPQGVGIQLESSPATISGNVIEEGKHGIYCQDSSPKIRDNRIKNAKEGISCFSSDLTIIGNIIKSCDTGIYSKSSKLFARQNQISDASVTGISVTKSRGESELVKNRLKRSKIGIYCKDSSVKIADNFIQISDYGIYCESSQVNIFLNIIDGCKESAIALFSNSEAKIETNEIINSQKRITNIITARSSRRVNTEDGKTGSKSRRLRLQKADNRPSSVPMETRNRASQGLTAKQKSRLKILQKKLKNPAISQAAKIKAEFEAGRLHFLTGKYKKALEKYDDIVSKFGKEKQPRITRITRIKEKTREENKSEYEQELANVHYHRALSHYMLGQYEAAIAACMESLSMNPKADVHRHINYILGMSYLQIDRLENAKASFFAVLKKRRAIRGKPDEILAKTYFQLGQLKEQSGDYSAAIDTYRNGLDNTENSILQMQIASALGYCYGRKNDYDSALKFYEKVTHCYSGNRQDLLVEAYHAMGDIYAKKKRWHKAQSYYSRAIERSKGKGVKGQKGKEVKEPISNQQSAIEKGELHFKLAESLLAQNIEDRAFEAYKKALQLSPDAKWKADALYQIAEGHFSAGEYLTAVDFYKKAIKDYTNQKKMQSRSVIAKYQVAESLYRLAEKRSDKKAKESYRRAMQAYKDAYQSALLLKDNKQSKHWLVLRDSLYGKAMCAKQLGELDEVVSAADELAKTSEDDVDGLLQAADLLFDSEKYSKASKIYEKALSHEGLSLQAKSSSRIRLGICYSTQNLKRKALGMFADAINELKEKNAEMEMLYNAEYQKALIHKELGEYDIAGKLLADVFKNANYEIRKASKIELAEVYEKQGRIPEAMQLYENIVNESSTLYPAEDINYALFHLGELYRKQQKYDKALKNYETFLNHAPEDASLRASAMFFAALCYSNLTPSKNRQAIELYSQVIDKCPASDLVSDAYFNIAKLHSKSGEDEQAIEACQKIIGKYESSSEEHEQKIVRLARNLMTNLLLEKERASTGTELKTTAYLRTQLEKIIQSVNSTAKQRANAYFELGNIDFREGKYQEAVRNYDKATSQARTPARSEYGAGETPIDYRKTVALFRMKEYDRAIEAGKLALASKARIDRKMEMQLHYLVGQSQLKMGQFDDAMRSFNAVVLAKETEVLATSATDNEMVANSHLYLGYIYSKKERYDDALKEYQRTLVELAQAIESSENISTKAEAYLRMAKLYEKKGKKDDAVEAYNKLLAIEEGGKRAALPVTLCPADSSPLATRLDDEIKAKALYRRGLIFQNSDGTKALKDLKQLTAEYKNSKAKEIKSMVADAEERLFSLYAKDGKVDDAIEAGKRALKKAEVQDSVSPAGVTLLMQMQYKLASLYQKKAKSSEGKWQQKYVRKSFRLYKNTYDKFASEETKNEKMEDLANKALFQAGQIAYQSGNFQLAIEPLETFLIQFPDDEVERAALPVEKVLTANKYLAWAYYSATENTSSINQRNSLYKKASTQFENLATSFPEEIHAPDWWYQAAQSAKLARKSGRAVEMYRNLAKTYPSHELSDDAMYAAGSVLMDEKKYDSAIAEYEKLLEDYPESEYVDDSWYSMAVCYDELGNHKKAVEKYNLVMQRYPESHLAAESQANIGHYYFNNKNYERALEEYRKLNRENFPGIESDLLMKSKNWLRDTENLLSKPIYKEAVSTLKIAKSKNDRTEKYAQKSIKLFSEVVNKYPHSNYVEHSIVSIGTAYETLEQWDKALEGYQKYLKRKNMKDQKLRKYALERSDAIKKYIWQKEKFE